MYAKVKMALTSLIAAVVASLLAIGVPPSEYVQEPNPWLIFEPLILPCLGLGVLLALLALGISFLSARWSACACLAAIVASALGVTISWGIHAQASLRALLVPLGLLLGPAVGAATGLPRQPQEPADKRRAAVPPSPARIAAQSFAIGLLAILIVQLFVRLHLDWLLAFAFLWFSLKTVMLFVLLRPAPSDRAAVRMPTLTELGLVSVANMVLTLLAIGLEKLLERSLTAGVVTAAALYALGYVAAWKRLRWHPFAA